MKRRSEFVNTIICGDALKVLKTMPDACVDCVVTSPPYWAIRDYGVAGQMGREPTLEVFLARLCDVFTEVKRVLKEQGTCWVNMGDTYAKSTPDGVVYSNDSRQSCRISPQLDERKNAHKPGLPGKCLLQIPSRFAIEMCNRGWILRSEIIWWKPNCMPASVKDRFTVDFEKLFFFVKSRRYWFEAQREGETRSKIFNIRVRDVGKGRIKHTDRKASAEEVAEYQEGYREIIGRNKRCIWRIPVRPHPQAHFAVYPPKLCETPIKAGCPEGGIVLDPFMGSGTTAVVARSLNRNFIGIELNPDYVRMAEERLRQSYSSPFSVGRSQETAIHQKLRLQD